MEEVVISSAEKEKARKDSKDLEIKEKVQKGSKDVEMKERTGKDTKDVETEVKAGKLRPKLPSSALGIRPLCLSFPP